MTDNTLDTLDSTIRRPNRLLAMLRAIGLLRESVRRHDRRRNGRILGSGGGTRAGVVAIPAEPAACADAVRQAGHRDSGRDVHRSARPASGSRATGTYRLGGDNLGRDILSRLMWGTQRVLVFASLATALAYSVGIVMGLAAGYFRGWIDDVLSRFSDLILSFPILVLYVVIITTFGASAINIMLAVVFASQSRHHEDRARPGSRPAQPRLWWRPPRPAARAPGTSCSWRSFPMPAGR